VEDDLSRAGELGEAYADLDLGVVDASVIALCEGLGLEIVLTPGSTGLLRGAAPALRGPSGRP
jgi:hypothetical protein